MSRNCFTPHATPLINMLCLLKHRGRGGGDWLWCETSCFLPPPVSVPIQEVQWESLKCQTADTSRQLLMGFGQFKSRPRRPPLSARSPSAVSLVLHERPDSRDLRPAGTRVLPRPACCLSFTHSFVQTDLLIVPGWPVCYR